jgi:hypothetical protein
MSSVALCHVKPPLYKHCPWAEHHHSTRTYKETQFSDYNGIYLSMGACGCIKVLLTWSTAHVELVGSVPEFLNHHLEPFRTARAATTGL